MNDDRLLLRWVAWVARHPRVTLIGLLVVTILAAWVAVDRYAMNSRLGDLVQQEGGWREDYEAFQAAFPQLVETAIVVVKGNSLQRVEETALALEQRIAVQTDLFEDVYAPANDAFFAENAFLYMAPERLYEVSDALAQAQPLLGAIASDTSLRGVLGLVAKGVSESAPEGFDQILRWLGRSAEAANNGADARIYWRDEFFKDEAFVHYRLIFLRGKQNYGVALPNAEIVARLRDTVNTLVSSGELAQNTDADSAVHIALTGEVALRHDEVQAATSGVKIAGTGALLLLGLVLSFGVRSARIVAAIFVVLLVGATWTAAWAMLAVGSYNTLSLVFLVMFFGLGVDFCVHYCLRVQEAVRVDSAPDAAPNSVVASSAAPRVLSSATRSVGGAVILCTVTTAIGFLGFVPTPYKGLADLGVISAGGMLVACILTFTLLPALFAEFGLPRRLPSQSSASGDLIAALARHRLPVFCVLGLLVVGCVSLLPRIQFDYSVLALRDASAESMVALRDLQAQDQITDYALYALVEETDLETQQTLEALATVERVITPQDYLPTEQEEKLYILEDLQELLGGSLTLAANQVAPDYQQLRAELSATISAIDAALEGALNDERRAALQRLRAQLGVMLEGSVDVLDAWHEGVVTSLAKEINWLAKATQVGPATLQQLPAPLKERLITSDGRYLSAILPAQDITPVAALTEFVTSVRDASPHATGRPVVEWGVGNIVVGAFKTALTVALAGIAMVLLVVLRSVRDTVFVLIPLLLTALFTVATSVLIGVNVNMASVLVLPLIFGLGVDNGIHMVERYRGDAESLEAFMHSSTPRAVLLSTLTTIGTFAALMLSPHAGTASIGFLLTVAVGYLLLFTVVLLPLLLTLSGGSFGAGARQ